MKFILIILGLLVLSGCAIIGSQVPLSKVCCMITPVVEHPTPTYEWTTEEYCTQIVIGASRAIVPDDNCGCIITSEEECTTCEMLELVMEQWEVGICENLELAACGNYLSDNNQYEYLRMYNSTCYETPPICPAVCVPMYVLINNECEYTDCGSGCGADGITTFETEAECLAKIAIPICSGMVCYNPKANCATVHGCDCLSEAYYMDYQSCLDAIPECTTNSDCPQNTCFGMRCFNGKCQQLAGMPAPPHCFGESWYGEKSEWIGYPDCKWVCKGNILCDWTTWAPEWGDNQCMTAYGIILVIIFIGYFLLKKK